MYYGKHVLISKNIGEIEKKVSLFYQCKLSI
jgi:hypothetical protein